MKLSTAKVLAALRASGWSQVGAARLLGVRAPSLALRVRRVPELSAAWRENAPRGGRVGRPAAHHTLTLDAVTAALREHRTHAAAARALGVTPQAVKRWVTAHDIATEGA